jgi:hypothetical protein
MARKSLASLLPEGQEVKGKSLIDKGLLPQVRVGEKIAARIWALTVREGVSITDFVRIAVIRLLADFEDTE